MKDHGVLIWPPSQPSKLELKQTSCAESGSIIEALVAMHKRSEAASTPPNAQQQPQLDWSRMSPMIFAHCGQFSSESKLSGISTWGELKTRWTFPAAIEAWSFAFQPSFRPA